MPGLKLNDAQVNWVFAKRFEFDSAQTQIHFGTGESRFESFVCRAVENDKHKTRVRRGLFVEENDGEILNFIFIKIVNGVIRMIFQAVNDALNIDSVFVFAVLLKCRTQVFIRFDILPDRRPVIFGEMREPFRFVRRIRAFL